MPEGDKNQKVDITNNIFSKNSALNGNGGAIGMVGIANIAMSGNTFS